MGKINPIKIKIRKIILFILLIISFNCVKSQNEMDTVTIPNNEVMVKQLFRRCSTFFQKIPTYTHRDTAGINNSKKWVYYYEFGDSINLVKSEINGRNTIFFGIRTIIYPSDTVWNIMEIYDYDSKWNNSESIELNQFPLTGKVKIYSVSDYRQDISYYLVYDYKYNSYFINKILFNGNILNGKLDGTATYYTNNENKVSEIGSYNENKKQGEWKYYYFNGKIKATGNYLNDLRENLWIYYFNPDYVDEYLKKDNYIFQKGEFKSDLKNGLWEENWITKKVYSELNIFENRYSYDIPVLKINGNYSNGEKNGEWLFSNNNSEIFISGHYKNGIKNGKWHYNNIINQQKVLTVTFEDQNIKDTILIYDNFSFLELNTYSDDPFFILPIGINGTFVTKVLNNDLSYHIADYNYDFTKYNNKSIEYSFTIKAIGEVKSYDKFKKILKIQIPTDIDNEKTTIIIPKKYDSDHNSSHLISSNSNYYVRVTDKYLTVIDLKNKTMVTTFEHFTNPERIEFVSNNGNTVVLSGSINNTDGNHELFYISYNISNKTQTPSNKIEKTNDRKFYYKEIVYGKMDAKMIEITNYEEKLHIPISKLGKQFNKNKLNKYSFSFYEKDNSILFYDENYFYIYNFKSDSLLYLAPLTEKYYDETFIIDSSKILCISADKLYFYDLKTKKQESLETDIYSIKFGELDIIESNLFGNDMESMDNYFKINLSNGNASFYDKELFYLTFQDKFGKNGKFNMRNWTSDLTRYKDSIDQNSPIHEYFEKNSHDLMYVKNGINDKFTLIVNNSLDLIFYNNYKRSALEKIINFNIFNNNSYIFYSPDQFYMGDQQIASFIKFQKGIKAYPFEQFDLKYNRPDIILERLGYSDSITIASYHNAYIKRLKRMNFTEDMLKDDFHLPEIKIKNFEYLPTLTDSSDLNLDLDIKDSKYKLDRINIFINDVPVFGTAGIDLRKENIQELNKKIKLSLSEGENKIQVSVLNQAGAESYKETAYITYKPKKSVQPDLYLVTIGDSKYSDSRYDLTYASKDATDIKNAFEKNPNSLYGAVHAFNYTDTQVTKENILKLKSELQKAKRDDVVIITVAGHGVLDKNLDYYLATHDMNFSNPSEKGLPYEELESLLDGIAPLKKVLFLDACHSGEVDKEEVELLATNTTTNSKVKFRNAGAGIQKKNLGLKTTSELMSELFTDLRRGTGATVISSAGGAEYAMESDEWKNGLFTYCLLHGLQDKAADENKDGQIMLSELQNYLRKEVTSLSNGAQQPTSRIENLSMDFRLW